MGWTVVKHSIRFFVKFCKHRTTYCNFWTCSVIKGRNKKNNMESLNIQIDKNNVEQQKAFDLVANTNTCLFITDKAGTGKTTFIKRIQAEISKNFFSSCPHWDSCYSCWWPDDALILWISFPDDGTTYKIRSSS